ncbi:MAG: hypothetical protein KIT79_15375 [Deltaproteobacteria bacterium]|nr:hypothetical protein [Deltaproteobacteria bacterium]
MKSPLVIFGDVTGGRFKHIPFGTLWKLLRAIDTEILTGYAYADLQDHSRTQLLDFAVPVDCHLFCHEIELDIACRAGRAVRIDLFAGEEQLLPARSAFIGGTGILGMHALGPEKLSLKVRRMLAPGTRLRIFGTPFPPYRLRFGDTPLTPQGSLPQYDVYNADDPVLGSLSTPFEILDWSPGTPIPAGWPLPPLEQRVYFKGKGRITFFANLTLSAPDPGVITAVQAYSPDFPYESVINETVIGTNVNPWTKSERMLTVTPRMELAEYAFRVHGGTGSSLNNLKVYCIFQEAPLNWENSVVINARIRGTRIPRDIFRTFGEL